MVSHFMSTSIENRAVIILDIALALVGAILASDGPHWIRRYGNARTEDKIVAQYLQFYKARPTTRMILPLYRALADVSEEAAQTSQRERLRLRVLRALEFEGELKNVSECHARKWLESVGQFARHMAIEKVDLRGFLGTYHLSILRDGAGIIPVAISLELQNKLDDIGTEWLYWGVALFALAVRYNSAVRFQRGAVFVEDEEEGVVYGPIVRPPEKTLILWYSAYGSLKRPYKLGRIARWRALRAIQWCSAKCIGQHAAHCQDD